MYLQSHIVLFINICAVLKNRIYDLIQIYIWNLEPVLHQVANLEVRLIWNWTDIKNTTWWNGWSFTDFESPISVELSTSNLCYSFQWISKTTFEAETWCGIDDDRTKICPVEGLSEESIKPPITSDNSLAPGIIFHSGTKIR